MYIHGMSIKIYFLKFYNKNKGLAIHASCIMSILLHVVASIINTELMIGDLKRFTISFIVKIIQENSQESRKEFLLFFYSNTKAQSLAIDFGLFSVF
ncbi:MAG: hypothetical protein ACI8QQ_002440 [Psychroserpens sp.]|jgi:hypothetical protein